MYDVDINSSSLKRRIQRLLGSQLELIWIRGSDLDPVIGEAAWIEQILFDMAVRARVEMPFGGRLVIECCNLDLNEITASSEALTAGRYVMFEMTCVRGTPASNDGQHDSFACDFVDNLWLDCQLTQSLQILRAIGGTICEYNEPGRALTLRAFLPSAATLVYSDEEDVFVTDSASSDTILLVEDEGFVRNVACEILESAGYKVLTAQSPKEAIAVFEDNAHIDLLLTDVVMPGMNGRDLSLKLTSLRPELKTIYMSGYTENALLRHDFEAKTVVYLQKPFTLESLTNAVREVLSNAAVSRN